MSEKCEHGMHNCPKYFLKEHLPILIFCVILGFLTEDLNLQELLPLYNVLFYQVAAYVLKKKMEISNQN